MPALMGIARQRVPDHVQPILILPHPLEPGQPHRTDPAGQKLWNPNWLSDTPYADPYNRSFFQAVIKTVQVNAKVTPTKKYLHTNLLNPVFPRQAPGSENALEDPDCQYAPLLDYTKQYFKTLIGTYKTQVDPAVKIAYERKKDRARHYNRKTTKYNRRTQAVTAFHAKYGGTVEDLNILSVVQRDYMSSDDDGPEEGEEGHQAWSEHYPKYASRVSSVVMVVPKKWRAFQVSAKIVGWHFAN